MIRVPHFCHILLTNSGKENNFFINLKVHEFPFAPIQTGPPSLLYNGYWIFPGGKVAGVWC